MNFASTKTSKRKHASFSKFEYVSRARGGGGAFRLTFQIGNQDYSLDFEFAAPV